VSDGCAPGDSSFKRLRRLTEVSRALTYTTSIQEVLRLAVERAAELVDADRALIMLADDDGLLSVRATHGLDPELVQQFREPFNETLIRRLQQLLEYQADESFLGVPLVVQGEVTGLLATVRPGGTPGTDDEWLLSALADQAAVALENARLIDSVRYERDERGRADADRRRIHAMLGHELRGPLTVIQAYSSLLLDGTFDPLTDRQREGIARIRLSGEHLLSVIQNLLAMVRLNSGSMTLPSCAVPIASVLEEALQMLQPLAAAKEQELAALHADDLVVQADPDRVRQALLNLVENAIKYTPNRGTIEVALSSCRRDGARCAAVAIRDSGRGIAAPSLRTIFEAFDRGANADHEAGLGLGLFISRELIRRMGGDIEVQSKPGSGSTFTVFLPLAPEPAEPAGSSPP
jgi:phosphoserine phosphatase RsbU/P